MGQGGEIQSAIVWRAPKNLLCSPKMPHPGDRNGDRNGDRDGPTPSQPPKPHACPVRHGDGEGHGARRGGHRGWRSPGMTGAHPPRAGWCCGSAPRHGAANKATAFIPSNNSAATHGCSHLRVLPPMGAAPSKTPPLRPLSPTSALVGLKIKPLETWRGEREAGVRVFVPPTLAPRVLPRSPTCQAH